jgi:hypothetical protein
MTHSSLLGVDRQAAPVRGRDSLDLGPSDSSDSGSDVAGLERLNDGDPMLPIDVATAVDRQHPYTTLDALGEANSDAAGTGERRSAGADDSGREAFDIAPDRIVETATDLLSDDPDSKLDSVLSDAMQVPPEDDEDYGLDDEDEDDVERVIEDEDDDPVGNRDTEPDGERRSREPGRESLRVRSQFADVAVADDTARVARRATA